MRQALRGHAPNRLHWTGRPERHLMSRNERTSAGELIHTDGKNAGKVSQGSR